MAPTTPDLQELAVRYAPLVVLHAEDKLRPSSPDRFVTRSQLRWATGRGLRGEPIPGTDRGVEPGRLGAARPDPYRTRGFDASALTRPLDDHAARRGAPPLEQGFFLRLREESAARGDKSTSPDPTVYAGVTTYWDYDEATGAMTYWVFYAGSSPPLGILRAGEQIGVRGVPVDDTEAAIAAAQLEEFERAYPGLALQADPMERTRDFPGDVLQRLRTVAAGVRALLRADGVMHEGDWERITVYLDGDDPAGGRPAWVVFYRHSTNTVRRWKEVELRDGTHPAVFSAIGSHASLPSPGFGFIDVGDPDGPRWRTWEDLAPIVEQPWYGFGGAWGRLGRVRDATGPLGPGAHWKHAAPRPAG